MKTNILKWDVNIQWLLVVLNTTFLCFGCFIPDFGFFFLVTQFIEGVYQLSGSGINLALNHKSIGFINLRRLHFFGSVIYLIIVFGAVTVDIGNAFIALVMFILIPQIIFYGYFLLCRKELQFLVNREFHILK